MTSFMRRSLAVSFVAAAPLLFLGCASSQQRVIPSTAIMMNDAHGDITVAAPHDGTVYVYDKSNDQLVYSGKVNRDDVIRLDEQTGNIDVNDRIVAGKSLDSDHDHQIYFDRTHEAREATYVEPNGDTTIIHHDDNGTHETTVVPRDSD